MAKKGRGRPKKSKEITIKSEETKIFFGLVVAFVGIIFLSSQIFDGSFFDFINKTVGIGSITSGITFLLIASSILGYKSKINSPRTIIGMILLTLLISTTAHFIIPAELALIKAQEGTGGGYIGYYLSQFLIDTFGRVLGILFIIGMAVISFSLISGVTLDQIKDFVKKFFTSSQKDKIKMNEEQTDDGKEYIGDTHDELKVQDETPEKKDSKKKDMEELSKEIEESTDVEINTSDDTDKTPQKEETMKYPEWILPPKDLLDEATQVKTDPEKHKEMAKVIEKTLESFGIHGKVSEISIGPRVVQYALSITVGTKVARVKSLGNDLALALAAPSGSVRIEAPIPGTSLIGIEMPKLNPSIVALSEVLSSDSMTDPKIQLPLAFGKDVSGKIIVKDLTKMPHVLIAGATGSGKSICVNAFLIGLLMRHSPDYLKFILVDPKMVELPPYNGIPHLLTPVITDIEKVAYSLDWLVVEMQRRFRILNKAGVRNILEYNNSLGFPALPYIVLVVDEMADIMLTAGLEVESKIVRLAQMARAVGIHLILATQRPSVDVLTGLIKANIPARIAMNVATTIDSRVILDIIGAENLLGNGDMLFKAPDISRPYRIQGALVTNEEVKKITDHIKSQVEKVNYNKEVTKPTSTSSSPFAAGKGSDDPLFATAVKIVASAGKASSSLLQRKLRVGYNRAARLMDELYESKVVGPQDGSKPRDVLISDADAFLKKLTGEEQAE